MQSEARSQLQTELAMPALADPAVRTRFCLLCIERVAHLLERREAIEALAEFRSLVQPAGDQDRLQSLVIRVASLARNHAGSRSIDGTGHASVSATHALAKAVAGDAIATADYCAYAATYSYGGYAVQDIGAFDPEYMWQLQGLRNLVNA